MKFIQEGMCQEGRLIECVTWADIVVPVSASNGPRVSGKTTRLKKGSHGEIVELSDGDVYSHRLVNVIGSHSCRKYQRRCANPAQKPALVAPATANSVLVKRLLTGCCRNNCSDAIFRTGRRYAAEARGAGRSSSRILAAPISGGSGNSRRPPVI